MAWPLPAEDLLHMCRAANFKAGGVGMRYTCMVRNRQTYLFTGTGGGLWSGIMSERCLQAVQSGRLFCFCG